MRMHTPPSVSRLIKRVSISAVSACAFLNPIANAQCSSQPPMGQFSVAPGTIVYYAFDSTMNSVASNSQVASPESQISEAFNEWNTADNSSGLDTQFLPADANHAAVITIKADSSTQSASATTQPNSAGTVGASNPATITFHPLAELPGTTTPIFQPQQSGFGDAYMKAALHEIGHLLGIGDYASNTAPYPNVSVMGPFDGPNDTGSSITAPTSCDANQAKTDSTAVTGGGTSSTSPGSCSPDSVAPACMQWSASTCSYQPICIGGNCCGTSPILIDTDHSGFHLTSRLEGVKFDFFGDGKPVQIAWTARGSTNGWLALDRNGDGKIDCAQELFGNITPQPTSETPNGYKALAVYDSNADGVIDKNDAIWPQLLVWIDKNHDGKSDSSELFTLDELGIRSIDLKYAAHWYVDPFGNIYRYKGSLVPDPDGDANRITFDVFLNSQ